MTTGATSAGAAGWADQRRGGSGHVPALDGVRGLAVAAVVAYHLEPDLVPGGYLGVDLFFVLSGYLITSLLLDERERTGRVDLLAFAGRRIRRLVPALIVLVPVVVALEVLVGDPGLIARTRRHALATLGHVANWVFVADGDSYFDVVSRPSPLRHAWSLAVEEQFYLLWPALLVVTSRLTGARGRALVTVGLVTASALASALVYDPGDPGRAYFGTDTRMFEPLVGALGALVLPLGATGPRWLARLGTPAILVWLGVVLVVDDAWAGLHRGGGLVLAFLGLLVVLGASSRWAPFPTTLKPLVGLGVVSYGVYLWHWPLVVFLSDAGRRGWMLDALVVSLTLAVAVVSFVVVERPIRRGRPGRSAPPAQRWRPIVFGPTAVVAAALLVVAIARPLPDRGVTAAGVGTDVADDRLVVVLVGDSSAWTLGGGRITPGDDQGTYESPFDPDTIVLVDLARKGFRFRFAAGTPTDDEVAGTWLDEVDRRSPDLVVALFGLNDLATLGDDEPPVTGPGPRLVGDLARRAPVLLLGPPPLVAGDLPDPVAASFFAEAGAQLVDRFSSALRDLAAGRPRVTFVDLGAWMCPGPDTGVATRDGCRTTPDGRPLRSDGVHYSPEGARLVAAWLEPLIVEAAGS